MTTEIAETAFTTTGYAASAAWPETPQPLYNGGGDEDDDDDDDDDDDNKPDPEITEPTDPEVPAVDPETDTGNNTKKIPQ